MAWKSLKWIESAGHGLDQLKWLGLAENGYIDVYGSTAM